MILILLSDELRAHTCKSFLIYLPMGKCNGMCYQALIKKVSDFFLKTHLCHIPV